ncbi:MAG: serine dehydratase subunit alpha family protein [Elusimicrobia bacterium]|nr:serine dehydratase subunit alpha family protein [Elusimicrobiota bacterium]
MKKKTLLKQVLEHQVFPALGCTEPVSVALCAAYAAKALGEPVKEALFLVDSGTFKNGMGVNIPNTGGGKGNLLAGALGALIAKPELKMQILSKSSPALLAAARKMVKSGAAKIEPVSGKKGIHIEARLSGAKNRAVCIIAASHTHVTRLEKNAQVLINEKPEACQEQSYKKELAKETILSLAKLAAKADKDDLAYIRKGVEMNLAAAAAGSKMKKVGFYLKDLKKRGFLLDDVFSSSKILTACATDARMEGLPVPVMSSGESGNQGIVASLVPYNVGKAFKVPEKKILQSIALSHMLNAYVKVHTGGLAPICGCAIAAGVGAAAAIVFQLRGPDNAAMSLAVNNLISDIGGMLCDGAKAGCALKVVSSTDAAIRSAYMGIHHYGITEVEGFVGRTAEDTIRNLASISTVGMQKVDPLIVNIMANKQNNRTCLS